MANSWDELREAADRIDRVARACPAWTMIHAEVTVCTSYIRAKARIHELNAKEARRDAAANQMR